MRAMREFGGTVLFVSHDRYFVENIATRVILVKNGKVTDYPGDYHYYLDKLASEDRYGAAPAPAKSAAKGASQGGAQGGRAAAKPSSAAAQAGAEGAGKGDRKVPGSADRASGNDAGDRPSGHDDAARASGAGAPAGSGSPPSAGAPSGGSIAAAPAKGGGPQDWEAKKEAERQRRKAEKRWAEIEAEITQLDQKVATLDAELCLPETYADSALSQKLAREKQHAEASLASLYQELEKLEADGYAP
jgi:ATP-binding cassette subfamily F protein 3